MREKQTADLLLSINAVTLQPEDPFTWSSGIKSPIYCDNRLIMSYPAERQKFIDLFVSYIKDHFPEVEVLAGTATAGIPHAAWIADRLDLPMVYVRSSSKGHGKQNRIEGKLNKGKRVLVIEDLISTGGSSIEAAKSVEDAGGKVLGICSIFTYELPLAEKAEKESGYSLHSLTTYSFLLKTALENKQITDEQLKLLQQWREDPEGWMSV
ncbi:orotate phosphoribosyltransferase [Salipaludibacillus aurantiacus]|uniref:Orotate phosphoribosyltransferase n=1 Tax=Salipaludibacillus aurantiacus TaxID=1601833 RepID=A0A1H9QQZ0_9BACI|nr:orotate phosphoribosyltransferase [Salipaludibacillus aurantiacus]SER62926.1 orotate phosphoribosyltransferase [Salipaludibacillus aurantiacus]